MGGAVIDYFVLDHKFRRTNVIDQYNSMIWSERYDNVGTCELVFHETNRPMNYSIVPGVYLGNSKSNVIMKIESVSRKFVKGEGVTFTYRGKSLQNLLSQRAIFVGVKNPNFLYRSNLADTICKVVERCFVRGSTYFPDDAIDGFTVINDAGTVEAISSELKPRNLLETVLELLPMKDIGFEVYPVEPYGYHFRVYDGAKRQGVMLSVDFDNVTSEQHLTDISEHKNVAYVWSGDQTRFTAAYANDPAELRDNIDRKVLQVDASDIRAEDYETDALFKEALQFRGLQELAKCKRWKFYDAEIEPNTFTYRKDFFLGDVVKVRGLEGRFVEMMLVENTWTHDREGFKSIPTVREV